MRLFVAAYPSLEALDDLADFIGRLGLARYGVQQEVNVRLTARELWHVTMAFLGEVPEERVDAGASALDNLSAQQSTLRIGGGGRFGRGRFTLMWAGLRGEVDVLAATAAGVRSALRKSRLRYDRKPFRPHLTIARPGDRAPAAIVAADIVALNQYDGPEWICDEICLVRSHLGPKPAYEVLHRVRL
jgi:2'-5' RNA ligase